MTTTRYAYDTETVIHLIAHWCNGCGIAYGLPQGFIEARQKDHQSWTCPNGCVRHYPKGPSEEDRLRKEVERQRVRANGEAARRRLAERQRAAAKGQVTKIRNRVSKGVCLDCNRTFPNLAAHMETKHNETTGDHA